MSESEIQTLCEQYINRPFDAEDVQTLRSFLHDLMKQKVEKPVSVAPHVVSTAKETKVLYSEEPVSPLVNRDAPIFQKTEAFVRAVSTTTIEKTAPINVGGTQKISERLDQYKKAVTEQPPVSSSPKADLPPDAVSPRHLANVYAQRVQESNLSTSDPSTVEERLKEAKVGPGVKDRLGGWAQVLESADKPTSAPADIVEERLAEVKGAAGVKDRLGNWSQVLESAEKPTSVPADVVEGRLAEVKGAAPVKDRLGNWTQVTEGAEKPASAPAEKVEERLAEVKGAAGVKDRLGNWQKVVSETAVTTSASDPSLLETRLGEEIKSSKGVKDRLVVLQDAVAETEKVITADPELVQERLTGIGRSTSIRDRAGIYSSAVASSENLNSGRKEPIELPTEELTKEQQGM